jgi:cytoskeletal protein CcmA (bactofilin family)
MKKRINGLSTPQMLMFTGALSAGGAGYISSIPTSAEISAQNFEVAATMFSQIEDAALNDYVLNGAWSSNLDTLISNKAYFGSKIGPYGTTFNTSPNPDGSFSIVMTAKNTEQAKQIANMIGNGTVNGTTITKKVGTPAEGALRNSLLSDYVDITSTSQLKFQTDINMNGNDINGISQLESDQVTISGGRLIFPTTSIKESSPNALDFTAEKTSFSGDINAAGKVTAKDADITNSIKASFATLTNGAFTNVNSSKLTATDSTIATAEINRLNSNLATLKTVTAETLTVSGLTELADLVANSATFSDLISSENLNVSGKGIVSLLEADNIDVNNANITKAEVINLLSNVANISQLVSSLINANEVRSGSGVITNLTSTNAVLTNLTTKTLLAEEIDVESLKAVNAELESASAKTLSVLGAASFKTLSSELATITTANIQTVNADTVNATDANVTGKVTTKALQAQTANLGSLEVVNQLSTQTLAVTSDATVDGTLTTKTANVTSNLTVGGNTQTNSLSVTGGATLNRATANDVSANSFNVAQKLTSKMISVTNNMDIGGSLSTTTIEAGAANIVGELKADSVQASAGAFTNVNSTNVTVSSTATTRDLVVTAVATLNTANISNLVSQVSNVGTATGSSLSLTGNLNANSATFSTVQASGQGSFGSLDVLGGAMIRGPLTVQQDISANNVYINGILTASSASLSSLISSTISATGNVTGSDVKTSSGASLNSLTTGLANHEGRVTSMEAWIAQCKAKQTPECNR